MGAGPVVFCLFPIIQPRTVHKMGILHAQLLGTPVHHVHKRLLRPCQMLRHGGGTVVGGADRNGFEHVGNGHHFPGLQIDLAAPLGGGGLRGRHRVLQGDLSAVHRLHDQQHGHDLGDTGRGQFFVGVGLIKHRSMDVTNALSLDDTEIFSETDGRSHRFTLDSASGEDGLLVISYSAENILMAQDYKNNIKVNIAGNNYKLEWYDPAYDADHVANIGTNVIFHYNAETMMATVSISFTDVKCFDNEITVSTPTYSEPSLMGIARTTRLDSVALNPGMTEATVNGEGLALLSELSIYAQDKDGALYLLASVASDAITEDSCTVAIEIPENLPTGSYTLKAIGTVRNSEGEEIASPAVEASFDFVNENQPKAPISATPYTLRPRRRDTI